MSRSILGLLTVSLALAFAAPARADDCDCAGTPGYTLTMPATVGIGENFTACLDAPAGSVALILIGGDAGPVNTKYGPICVGFPFLTLWVVVIPPTGRLCLDHQVECDHDVVGFTGHFQFAAFGPAPAQVGLSNSQCLTAVNSGSCDVHQGDFWGFTQGGWGTKCNGGNPGCIRDANFANVFPNGLLLGDHDGIDGDGAYALVLTTSKAVQDFLPSGQGPHALTGDELNPTSSSAHVFAGQLASAKLNVAFDDAGVFDGVKGQLSHKLGDLVYVSGVASPLLGMSVRDLLDLADLAISGAALEPFDVDGDSIGDVTLDEIKSACEVICTNFDNGNTNNGNLGYP